MITILQIIPELNTGGAELSTLEITEAIVKAGGRALVATQGGRMADDLVELGGEIINMPVKTKNPIGIWQNANHLTKLIKTENIDLLHARSRAPAWSAKIAAQKTNCPFVTTYHGAYGNKNIFKNRYNRVMASGDIVIANSAFTAQLVQAQHAPDEKKLRIVHRGINVNTYNPETIAPERIEKLKQKWQIKPDEKVILNAARLTSWKGQTTLIEAVKDLKTEMNIDQMVFILAGDAQGRTDYEQSLKDQIVTAGLQNTIRLVGHCDDMEAAFAASDLSVVASTKPEAFGRAAVEAQALGCPVIVTEIGATAETVLSTPNVDQNERTGWRIPPANSTALAKALKEALHLTKEEIAHIGQNARSHVTQNFSLTLMQQKTLAIYDELLGTKLQKAFLGHLERAL